MAEERVQRRLAAILAADVVGYARLMEADEAGTLGRLMALRHDLFEPAIKRHGGRIFKTTGDGALVEFNSVVDAVHSAVEIQRGLAERDSTLPSGDSIRLRIGVSVGDVIVEGGDLYGNAVNVAARIEALAEPGGVCVSGAAYDHVAGKVDAAFEDLGPQAVKNIARPIRVLSVKPAAAPRNNQIADVSAPVPGFQGRPAIAVLPLENLSDDPGQEYFADGIAEDILTRLAMWRWCPIIARNSSFAYRGKSIDIRRIGRELGARYVLEGSVRKAADRVRVTAQLIETDSGHHVWADRYDRKLDDIFELQDDIVDAIAGALEPAVGRAERERARLKPPASLDAWDLHQRGMWHWYESTREGFSRAREVFTRVIDVDGALAAPHAMLGLISAQEVLFSLADDPRRALNEAQREAIVAYRLDSADAFVHTVLCTYHMFMSEHDRMIEFGRRATELNPSFALGQYVYGMALTVNCQLDQAIQKILFAMRISPNDPLIPFFHSGLGLARYAAGDYEGAVAATTIAVQNAPFNPMGLRTHAASLAQSGRLAEARQALAKFLENAPEFTVEYARRVVPFRDLAFTERYVDGLRKAGLPG